MPSSAVRFLTVDEVLVLHGLLIRRFGGDPGVRDPGLLESALHRPRTGYYPDLPSMAGALFESLLLNHPFVDGNKRVAFFATDTFLRMNGWRMEVTPREADRFLRGHLAAGTCDNDILRRWIADHLRRERGPGWEPEGPGGSLQLRERAPAPAGAPRRRRRSPRR